MGPQEADGPLPWAPQELKLKDEECERLSKVREQLEQELEELTASLFEVRGPRAGWETWGCGVSVVSSPLPTHKEPTLCPGSPQDGARSQHEAGGFREAAEGGARQGEALASPDLQSQSRPLKRWPSLPKASACMAWSAWGWGAADGQIEARSKGQRYLR